MSVNEIKRRFDCDHQRRALTVKIARPFLLSETMYVVDITEERVDRRWMVISTSFKERPVALISTA